MGAPGQCRHRRALAGRAGRPSGPERENRARKLAHTHKHTDARARRGARASAGALHASAHKHSATFEWNRQPAEDANL